MKSAKLISLAITMLISLVTFGQEKDSLSQILQNEMANGAIVNSPVTNCKVMRCCMPSISDDDSPLYIVNGKLLKQDAISKINPNDIESINILKGNSATSLYGYQARNGVIIIKIKNRKSAKI
jgi:TonB-dependent SusC/RagA subfamily outer membrane receptor